jgi:ribose/xylose/arabinose/galactoside ABC-type transport system permease subunit
MRAEDAAAAVGRPFALGRCLGAFAGSSMATTRAAVLLALIVGAISTPSFLTAPSLTALLTTSSVVGCLAAGMTFITISGNVMSFALGATAAAASVVFTAALNVGGLWAAIIASLLFGGAVTGLQGLVIGALRANPIIISIASNVMIYGFASWLTANETVFAIPKAGHEILKGAIWNVPIDFIIFLGLIAIGQFILRYTVFGRNLLLVGSGWRAAEAVGLPTQRTIFGGYLWAGFFTAVGGALLAIRYNQGNMSLAVHYDYDAIAAVLVGGTAIQGGDGSMIRTLVGVLAISTIQVVLLLYGFGEEWRYLIAGLIVLGVVILYSRQGVAR